MRVVNDDEWLCKSNSWDFLSFCNFEFKNKKVKQKTKIMEIISN